MVWILVLGLLVQVPEPVPAASAQPDYATVLAAIETQRSALAERLASTNAPSDRTPILREAETLLATTVTHDLAPYWYGTDWAYNGTSQIPGQGAIACGYFVTTLLRDAGLKLPRVRMAQVASEKMIRSLVADPFVWRFSNTPIDQFTAAVKQRGLGLYVVGLDLHTGFIVYRADGLWFVHSSYYEPRAVVCEPAEKAAILVNSRYRVIGKLSDPELLEKWLLGRTVPLR